MKTNNFSLQILDPLQVYDAINLGRRIDVVWPDEKMRIRGGRSYWKDWLPEKGMEGLVRVMMMFFCNHIKYNCPNCIVDKLVYDLKCQNNKENIKKLGFENSIWNNVF